MSTTTLLREMARALGVPSRLVPVPVGLMRMGAALVGKGDVARRIFSSLQVDSVGTQRLLGWTPPQRTADAFRQTAQWYLRTRGT